MLREIFQNAIQTVVRNPKTVISTVLAGTLAGALSFSHENAKSGQIPLAFSELGQTRLYVEKIDHKAIPALTLYYASLNDLVMQVFEANNQARNYWMSDYTGKFAYELEKKIEPTMRIHTQIPEYAMRIPAMAAGALTTLAKVVEAGRALEPALTALEQSWRESHTDVDKTVHYTVQVCSTDAKGKQSCKNEDRTKSEYDYTIHTYRYNATQGALGATLSTAFIGRFPNVNVDEKLFMAWQTNAENEWAIRESRKLLPGYKPPTKDEYLALANTWATGSNYMTLLPKAETAHQGLAVQAPAWQAAAATARSTSYTTYTHSDSGPKDYRIAMATKAVAADELDNLRRITDGIQYASVQAPILSKTIHDFVEASLHGGKGDAGRLGQQVLEEARQIYTRNYAGGFDPYPSNWALVGIWAVVAAGAAFGAARGANRYLGSDMNGRLSAFHLRRG